MNVYVGNCVKLYHDLPAKWEISTKPTELSTRPRFEERRNSKSWHLACLVNIFIM